MSDFDSEDEKVTKAEEEDAKDTIGEYYGQRNEEGFRHGSGQALLPNGDYYEGFYRKGERHGLGLYVFTSGARYSGNYHKGLKHGIGTFYYPDGSVYEGEWKKDLKHGYGSYTYPNGDVYEGQWYDGLKEGLGSYYVNKLGVKYLGTFVKGNLEGPGQLVTDAFRYHGVWKNNLPEGKGCFTFKSDCMQHGHHVIIKDPGIYSGGMGLEEQEIEAGEEPPKLVAVWKPREVTEYDSTRLPPEPRPFEYPPSDGSEGSSEKSEPDDVYQYDFFQDIAQYDQFYQDEKVLANPDKWDEEVNANKCTDSQLELLGLKEPDHQKTDTPKDGLSFPLPSLSASPHSSSMLDFTQKLPTKVEDE